MPPPAGHPTSRPPPRRRRWRAGRRSLAGPCDGGGGAVFFSSPPTPWPPHPPLPRDPNLSGDTPRWSLPQHDAGWVASPGYGSRAGGLRWPRLDLGSRPSGSGVVCPVSVAAGAPSSLQPPPTLTPPPSPPALLRFCLPLWRPWRRGFVPGGGFFLQCVG